MMKNIILLISILSFLFISCNNCPSVYSYQSPKFVNDGLKVGTLRQVGMDSLTVSKVIDCIYANKYDQIHSVLIYKDGLLVFEEYMQGNKFKYDGQYHYGERIQWEKDNLHSLMSCTKSVISAIAGIAEDKGFFDAQESIFNYLPDHQHYKTNGKEHISIEHLLTMSSGLEFDEWSTSHGSKVNDIDKIHWDCQDDPLTCILERSLKYVPGEKFNYNSGCTIVLGEIIKNATGQDMAEFADKYLFEPLGIDSVTWNRFGNGVIAGGGGLKITSRDMLKIGVCFLNNGVWNEQQIISPKWVELSKKSYRNNRGIKVPGSDFRKQGYSYSWWTGKLNISKKEVDFYAASGWGGQKIMVIDDLSMVVVFTGGNYVIKNHHQKILERIVLPSIE